MLTLLVNESLPGSTGVCVEGPFPELNMFLAQDLLLASNVRDLIFELRDVASDRAAPEFSNGNAWEVTPGREVTVVECSYGAPPTRYEVPTRALIGLLEVWLEYLEERSGVRPRSPVPDVHAPRH